MERIAVLPSVAAAQTFADYCTSRGLPVSVVVLSAQHAELYTEPVVAEQVLAELAAFAAEPDAARYNEAAWQLNQPNTQASGSAGLSSVWTRVRQQSGPLTLWLLAIAVLVYLAMQIWPQQVFTMLRLQEQQDLFSLRWWTPVLLHFSAAHLMFNALALLMYGGRLEREIGSGRFLLLLLLVGLGSNVAQALISGPYFGGLSGIVYGIFAFVWWYGLRYPQRGLALSKVDLGLALGFMALGFADLLWVNTANWAHLAGFISGLMLAGVLAKPR